MLKENVDYELVPSEIAEDAWSVRFLTGNYTETVVQFGAIRFNDKDVNDDGVAMSFNFDIVSTPDESLVVEDISLQKYAGDILLAIIENAISKDELVTKEVNGS
jgi:hypothetical protein